MGLLLDGGGNAGEKLIKNRLKLEGVLIVAYETKVLLSLLADTALRTNSKEMYKVIAKIANTEGMILKPYDEAKAELDND